MSRDDATEDETSGADLREMLGMSARPAPPSVPTGQVIDAYRIDGELGAGGMGRVYRAYDVRLERDVALKLLSAGADLRTESVALAKLAHPNVVAVFDVGTWNGHAWVAMEFVAGGTARAWARDRERSVREILALYVDAGRGLAAAHAAGIVHRDFKPDNVLVGRDGRARVADFGIAWAAGTAANGDIAGTPAYMAPEQRAGGAIDARADQFAFAVALAQALGDRAPRHVARALQRARAGDPAARFADMPALLAELARDPARRRRRIVAATGALAAVAAVAVVGWSRGKSSLDACDDGAATIARSWDVVAKLRVAARIASLPSVYGPEASARIGATFDDYAARWAVGHDASCRTHRAGGLSPAAFDRRTACFAARASALATAVEVAGTVERERLADLVAAAASLPGLATCEDDAELLAPDPYRLLAPPIAAVDARLARAAVERDAGTSELAGRDADAAVAEARALGVEPLIARALVARGRIDQTLWRGDRGAAAFADATTRAITSGDDALAVEAYARAAWARGTTADPERATEGLALVEAIATRLGRRAPFARALLDNNLGSLALARGRRDEARTLFRRAQGEAAPLAGSEALELTVVLMNLALVVDDPAQRAQFGRELVARRTALVGPGHPLVLSAAIAAAELVDDPQRVRAELAPPCRALHVLHPDQRRIASECGFELVWLALVDRDLAAARAALPQALADQPGDPGELAPELVRAYAALVRGDLRGARAAIAALHPDADSSAWWRVLVVSDVALADALASEAAGDVAATRAALARSRTALARIADSVPPPVLHRREYAVEQIAARAGH